MRVLAIDGGGIRGIIPAIVLTEIERRAGRQVFELFDLIAGTSTGGILACALAAPQPMHAARLVALYDEEGPKIFELSLAQRIRSAGGLLDEKYDDAALDNALDRFLSDKRLSQTRPDLIVPTYDTAAPGPYFFKTTKAREDADEDFPLSVVARATSAAPTYFEPLEVGRRSLIDGGVFALNPAMSAFAEVGGQSAGSEIVLLSLGTGAHTRKRPFDEVKDWGLVEWARPLIDVVFDGSSDAVDYQLRQVLEDGVYLRLQVELSSASDALDDASADNLRKLRRHGEQLVQAHDAEIDAIVAALG
jgi:patatin-like phospholipase/acyl hydrolase